MRRPIVIGAAFCASMFLPAVPASAAVTVEFALGVLFVVGDEADDTIAVECLNENVVVNGESPAGGDVACGAVESILVRAGAGADRVDVSTIGGGAFPQLSEIGVLGEEGADTLLGSKLADLLQGGDGADALDGGGGADRLLPGSGGGEVTGGGGRDTAVVSGDGNWDVNDQRIAQLTPVSEVNALDDVEVVVVHGGGGENAISGTEFTGSLVLDGGPGRDLLVGGPGRDQLLGKPGDDVLDGRGGNDLLEGTGGDDELRGGEGDDQLRGGPGDDDCRGGPGADSALSC